MTVRSLLDFALFQAVWLVSAFGAAYGHSSPGLLATLALLAWHLASTSDHRSSAIATVLAAGACGLAMETLLVGTGILRYSAPWPTLHLAPAWIVGLWLAFGTTLQTTHRLLATGVLWKSFALGGILGPLSYLAGQRLGALTITGPTWGSLAAISAVWAVAYPALLAVSAYAHRRD